MTYLLEKIKQIILLRTNYIKKGFSLFFLLPASLRPLFFDTYLQLYTVSRETNLIDIKKHLNGYLLTAGALQFYLPRRGFHEPDFFDIVFPFLGRRNRYIQEEVYTNKAFSLEGPYEYREVMIKPGDFVIDAGANVGLFSVVASKKAGLEGRIFSFEPIEEARSFLEYNVGINKCSNVAIQADALGECDGYVDFLVDPGEGIELSSKTLNVHGKSAHIQKVYQITLDAFVANNNIEKVDFIKADIEGAERDLLAGSQQVIKRFKPRIALRTYHLPDDPKVLSGLIKEYVPEYKIYQLGKTLYAFV